MNYLNKAKPNYLLNFAEVTIPEVLVRAGKEKYESKEQLRKLREDNGANYFFIRRGDTICNIPLSDDVQPRGEQFNLKLSDDLGISSGLLKDSIIRFLKKQNRKILAYEPITFLSEHKNDNLLGKSFPEGLNCPSWLGIQVQPEITVRPIKFNGGKSFVGIGFSFWTRNIISANVEQLQLEGIDVVGCYVSRLRSGLDMGSGRKFDVMGKAALISNGTISLEDTKDTNVTEIKAAEAYLEARKENLYHCLEVLYPKELAFIKKNLDRNLANFRSGPERISRIKSINQYFSKNQLELCQGVTVSIGQLFEQGMNTFPKVDILPRPTYVFDPSRQRTHISHDKGLDIHGPYDRATFNCPTPKVAVICQASKKGQVEQFVTKFCEGMPHVVNKKGMAPYGKGFVRKYSTNKWEIDFFTTTHASAEAYSKTALDVVETASISGRKWNLILIQIEDGFKALPAEANPYLTTKAIFLSHGYVTQDFTIETISKPDSTLAYSLNQMALATYAKLGGVPWLLSATPSVSHELIFGLGSSTVGTSRFGDRERIVGITTVFKGDGDYVLENRSKAVPFEEYFDNLTHSLRSTFNILKQRYNWVNGDSLRFIFHSFKPFKDVEVESVKLLMNEIAKDYKLEFAFLHVIDNHPFNLFDRNQPGVKDFESGKTKGVHAPTRGHYIEINKFETLVTLTGAYEVKKAEDGLPLPLLLRLHKGSTFTDMTYLSRQLYFLANHSWRTFMPSSMPITITYSELIARLLGELNNLPRWSSDAIVGVVGSSRWFL